MTRTAEDIRATMNALDLNDIAVRFNQQDEDDEDIQPLVVCEGVSVDVFNDADGRILVIDFPTLVHESTVQEFILAILIASGNTGEIRKSGSMTACRGGNPNKEADATFGPFADTPNRTPALANRALEEWITVAVEVGRSQNWRSLEDAARWWHGYDGIQYVLLLKVSASAESIGYRLYDVAVSPMGPRGPLPNPMNEGETRHIRNDARENIVFDTRRILSIPPRLALPAGMNDHITVNVRALMKAVMRLIRRH